MDGPKFIFHHCLIIKLFKNLGNFPCPRRISSCPRRMSGGAALHAVGADNVGAAQQNYKKLVREAWPTT